MSIIINYKNNIKQIYQLFMKILERGAITRQPYSRVTTTNNKLFYNGIRTGQQYN